MDSYVTQVLSIAQEIAAIGKALDDDLIAALLLQGLPNDYRPMKMAMENSGIELTTDYVKTKLLQEEYYPRNGNSRVIGESAYVSQYRSRFDESAEQYARSNRYKEADVNGERSSNSTRYLTGPCFICNRRGHKAANCYKNTNEKNSQRVEDQKRTNKKSHLTAKEVTMKPEKWYLDSGATTHMTNNKDCLKNYHKNDEIVNVTCADNGKLQCKGRGDTTVKLPHNTERTMIRDVTYVPKLSANLLSVSKLAERGRTTYNKNNLSTFQAARYSSLSI
jgi:hypothetical protein